MAEIDFALLTIPTPEPYEKRKSERQRENFHYVLNQLLVLAKDAGFVLSDQVTNPSPVGDYSGIEDAIKDLQYEGVILDGGAFKIIMTRKNTGVYHT